MEEEVTAAMIANDIGEESFDLQAQTELVQYLSKGEARNSEGNIAALDAFKKSNFARIFLRFFSQNDEEELNDNFLKLLDSMHLEQYSQGQNILIQSKLSNNHAAALLKKKFLFIINGSLVFGSDKKQDPPGLTSTFVLPNGIQARKRTFAENEVQLPRIFSPGEAITPSMYSLFSQANNLIACHEKNEEDNIEFKDKTIHVATLSSSQYNEIMEQMEDKKLSWIIQFMKISGIFSNITEEKLAKLANFSEIRETKCGSIIFQENEIADEIFLVIQGEFMITNQNNIDRFQTTDQQSDLKQPIQKRLVKKKQLFGDEEVSPSNGTRKFKAECVSQYGAVLVFQKHFFIVNSDIKMSLNKQDNNNSEIQKQQQSDFFMKQHFTRKSATNIQSLNQITDQQQSSMFTTVGKIPLDRAGQKVINNSEYDSPNNNNNNIFTKLQLSQMQSNTPVIAAYSKSNKHLSQILGSKFIPKNIPNLQKGTSMEESTTFNSQQPISQSPTIFTNQLGNGTPNGGGGNHFHSRSNIHFNNSYFSNGSNNESSKLFSPCVSQKELGDGITSPAKIKSSLFRARKYQSERSIQNLSPPVQDGTKLQGNVKTMEAQNNNPITTEEEAEGNRLIGEIIPEHKNILDSEKGVNVKYRPNPKKSEFFTHQFENNDLDEQKDSSNDDNSGNDTTQQPQPQINLLEQKGFYSPKKIIASPIQKKNTHRLFLNDSSPSIIFSKRAFQKGIPGRADSRIGSFGSQDFNYPCSDGIENDGTPTPNGAGQKNTNTADNTPIQGYIGNLSGGAPGLKINFVTRKKPVSVMGSFSQFQSLKHIHDCDDDENRQQIIPTSNNNENETQKVPSLPKRLKNASTIIFSKPLDLQDQDKNNLIGANSPQHPLKILKTLPLSRPQPSLSSTYFSHLSPKKSFVLKQSIPKESSNQDNVIPQSLPSPGMKTSLQNSLRSDLQQTFTNIQSQSEEGQILSSQKLNSAQKFPAHPQRHISKSQKHIFKSQPQLQLEVSQKIESDETSESEADESFTMYDNLAQTSIPLSSPNKSDNDNNNNSIPRQKIPAQSLKLKPSIPLLDLKSLGENGSQINNFFGNGQQNKNQFATEGNKPAISIEKSNELPNEGKTNSNEQSGNEIYPMKNLDNQPLSQSTTWYQSKTLTNICKMKPQEGGTEATTAKMLRSESQKPSKNQQPYIEIQSQRPSTPSMKKLNLSNLTAQIKKLAPQPNVKDKDDGFNEIQQSRLILPSFNFAQSGQTSSQPLFFNSQSNESSPTNQQFGQLGFSKGLIQDRKTGVGVDSLSFFAPQPLHALSPSSFNQFPMKNSGSILKQTQSNKNINLIYAGLLPSQTADRKAQKIPHKQGETLQEGSPIQEPV